MADWDWAELAVKIGIPLSSGFVGMIAGAWRGGRAIERDKQAVKEDYTGKIEAHKTETRTAMAAIERAAGARNELLVEQFKESFDGIRRQIDEVRLSTEKEFLRKDDFREFREEYREDQRRIIDKLDRLARPQ
jgi:hypothetical protein